MPSEGWPYCDFAKEIVVPAGTWYVLGDNRGPSRDSRHFGPIPTAWIAGKVLLPAVEEQKPWACSGVPRPPAHRVPQRTRTRQPSPGPVDPESV